MKIGTRLQVYKGTAARTSGNLHRKDLIKNRVGKIVSKRKQALAKKNSNLKQFLVGKPVPKKQIPKPSKPLKPKPSKPKKKAKIVVAPARRSGRVRQKPKRLGF